MLTEKKQVIFLTTLPCCHSWENHRHQICTIRSLNSCRHVNKQRESSFLFINTFRLDICLSGAGWTFSIFSYSCSSYFTFIPTLYCIYCIYINCIYSSKWSSQSHVKLDFWWIIKHMNQADWMSFMSCSLQLITRGTHWTHTALHDQSMRSERPPSNRTVSPRSQTQRLINWRTLWLVNTIRAVTAHSSKTYEWRDIELILKRWSRLMR